MKLTTSKYAFATTSRNWCAHKVYLLCTRFAIWFHSHLFFLPFSSKKSFTFVICILGETTCIYRSSLHNLNHFIPFGYFWLYHDILKVMLPWLKCILFMNMKNAKTREVEIIKSERITCKLLSYHHYFQTVIKNKESNNTAKVIHPIL